MKIVFMRCKVVLICCCNTCNVLCSWFVRLPASSCSWSLWFLWWNLTLHPKIYILFLTLVLVLPKKHVCWHMQVEVKLSLPIFSAEKKSTTFTSLLHYYFTIFSHSPISAYATFTSLLHYYFALFSHSPISAYATLLLHHSDFTIVFIIYYVQCFISWHFIW